MAANKAVKRRIAVLWAVTIVVLAVVFGVVLPSIISYEEIFDSISQITGVQFVALGALVAVRALTEGLTNTSNIRELSVGQGTTAHVGSSGIRATIPGPFDVATRVSMYTTWGVPGESIGIGLATGSLFFFLSTLSLPVVAVALVVAESRIDSTAVTALVLAGVLALVVVAAAAAGLSALRSESFAHRLAGLVGRVVHAGARLVRSEPPVDVKERILGLREDAGDHVRSRWWRMWGSPLLTSLVLTATLTLSLRFAGVDAHQLSVSRVLLAVALVGLITLIPITGGNVGIAELAYTALLVWLAADGESSDIVAGVLVFRLFTWLLMIPVGYAALFGWRRRWRNRTGSDPIESLLGG